MWRFLSLVTEREEAYQRVAHALFFAKRNVEAHAMIAQIADSSVRQEACARLALWSDILFGIR
jgi:hypothetical protein